MKKQLVLFMDDDLRKEFADCSVDRLKRKVKIFVRAPEGKQENRILLDGDGKRLDADTVDIRDLMDHDVFEDSCLDFISVAKLPFNISPPTIKPRRSCNACGMASRLNDIFGG